MKVITIGRGSDNDFVIKDSKVSRKHLQLGQNDNGVWYVIDLNSTNGTFVNGQKISGKVPLQHSDVIRIGNTTLPWQEYITLSPRLEEPVMITWRPQRHGFVTFWLWFGIICNIISTPISILFYQSLKNFGEYGISLIMQGVEIQSYMNAVSGHALVLQVGAFINAVLLIVGYWQLLNWKKWGFYLNAFVGVAFGIINILMMYFIGQEYLNVGLIIFPPLQLFSVAIGVVVSILIHWAILQIRKYGVSCWDQLK